MGIICNRFCVDDLKYVEWVWDTTVSQLTERPSDRPTDHANSSNPFNCISWGILISIIINLSTSVSDALYLVYLTTPTPSRTIITNFSSTSIYHRLQMTTSCMTLVMCILATPVTISTKVGQSTALLIPALDGFMTTPCMIQRLFLR